MVYIAEFWRSELKKIGSSEFIPQKKGDRLEVWLEDEITHLAKQIQVLAEQRQNIITTLDKFMEEEDSNRDDLETLKASINEKQNIYKDMTEQQRYANPQQQQEIETFLMDVRTQIEKLSRGIEEHVRHMDYLLARQKEETEKKDKIKEQLKILTTLYNERNVSLKLLHGESIKENDDDDTDDSSDDDDVTQEEVMAQLRKKMEEQGLDPSLLQNINVTAQTGLAPLDEKYLQMQREKDMIARMMKEQANMIEKIKTDYQSQLLQQRTEYDEAKKKLLEEQFSMDKSVAMSIQEYAFVSQALLNRPLSGVTLKEGFVYKAGGKLALFRKRWFILKAEGLFYFKNNKDLKKAQGCIPLEGIIDVLVTQDSKKAFLFNIITVKKTFPCKCDSHDDGFEWVSELKKAVDRIKKEKLKNILPSREATTIAPPKQPNNPTPAQPPVGPLANAMYKADLPQNSGRPEQPEQPIGLGAPMNPNYEMNRANTSSFRGLGAPGGMQGGLGGMPNQGLAGLGAPGGMQGGLGGMPNQGLAGLGAPGGMQGGLGGMPNQGLGGLGATPMGNPMIGSPYGQSPGGLGGGLGGPAPMGQPQPAAGGGLSPEQQAQLRALIMANPSIVSQLNPALVQQLQLQ